MAVNDLKHRRTVFKTAMAPQQHTVIHVTASASGSLNPSKSLRKLSVVGVVVLTVAGVGVMVMVLLVVVVMVGVMVVVVMMLVRRVM